MKVYTQLLLFVFLSFLACDFSDDDLTDIEFQDISVKPTVQLDYLPINLLGFSTPPIGFNAKEKFEEKVGVDNSIEVVQDVKLTEIAINLVQCDDEENFNFLDKVELYVKTPDSEKKLVAQRDEVPADVTSFSLTPTDDYLDDYVKNEDLKLIIKYFSNGDAINLEVEIDMSFNFAVDPL